MWRTSAVLCFLILCPAVSSDAIAACGDSRWSQDQKSASCYRILTPQRTWEAARKDCRSMGGDLVVVGSSKELIRLAELLQEEGVATQPWNAWLGFKRQPDSTNTYQWLDESPFSNSTTPWKAGEPSSLDEGENCGAWSIGPTSGGMADRVCSDALPYICEKPQNIQVRLVEGRYSFEGRVEVRRYNGEDWGPVCDDYFYDAEADVICRQLNLGSKGLALKDAETGSSGFYLDNLGCLGNETNLGQCPSRGWKVHDCERYEAAGVICPPPQAYGSALIGDSSSNSVPSVVLIVILMITAVCTSLQR